MSANGCSCEETLARLDSFLDGDLPPEEAMAVGVHLEACVPCRDALRLREGMIRLLRCSDSQPAPAALRRRVIEALLEEDARKPE